MPERECWEEREAIDYLLGRLDKPRRESLEERLLLDPECHQFLLNTEIDLVRDYIAEELPTLDMRAFEKHYLQSEANSDRVRLMRDLSRRSIRQSRTRLFWFAGAGWAACVVLGAGLLWQVANRSAANIVPVDGAKRVTVASIAGEPPLEATLRAGGSRHATNTLSNELVATPSAGARLVRLWLLPAEDLSARESENGVRAVFLSDSRRELAVLPVHFGRSRDEVYVECPVSVFEPGHYVLELRIGSGSVLESFSFRVLAK